MVPLVDIRRDPRFTLEENWEKFVLPVLEEANIRGCYPEISTVIYMDGIEGWRLHGYTYPSAIIIYDGKCPEPKEDYSI